VFLQWSPNGTIPRDDATTAYCNPRHTLLASSTAVRYNLFVLMLPSSDHPGQPLLLSAVAASRVLQWSTNGATWHRVAVAEAAKEQNYIQQTGSQVTHWFTCSRVQVVLTSGKTYRPSRTAPLPLYCKIAASGARVTQTSSRQLQTVSHSAQTQLQGKYIHNHHMRCSWPSH
jgi:hypothetical protein